MKLLTYLEDFVSLTFPNNCPGCGYALFKNEDFLCTKCLHNLPFTTYEKDSVNTVDKIFFGRCYIEKATSVVFFHKQSIVQKLLYSIKYKNNPELAKFLGAIMFNKVKDSSFLNSIDLIIPVPLHSKKQSIRGYNQAEKIADGISSLSSIPIDTCSLQRLVHINSLTKMNRNERREKIKTAFSIKNENVLENKHILLVDDVITTGATLESCAILLNQIANCKVSIISFAIASH